MSAPSQARLRALVDATLRPLAEEDAFRRWYAEQVRRTARPDFSLNPNPDAPEHHYDYRAAHRAGAKPALDPADGLYHWPSEFKADDHPRRFLPIGEGGEMVDTRLQRAVARESAAEDETIRRNLRRRK